MNQPAVWRLHTDGQGRTWHVELRDDGSVCVYWTTAKEDEQHVVCDSCEMEALRAWAARMPICDPGHIRFVQNTPGDVIEWMGQRPMRHMEVAS